MHDKRLETVAQIISDEGMTTASAIAAIQENADFVKGKTAMAENQIAESLNKRVIAERVRLNEFLNLEAEATNISNQLTVVFGEIVELHELFFIKITEVSEELKNHDGLVIQAEPKFVEKEGYRDKLVYSINQKSFEMQEKSNFEWRDNEQYEAHVIGVLKSLFKDEISLKSGYTSESLAQELASTIQYEISYDVLYDNDSLKSMSEGKMAFVILKLLLDFSEKQCPILIDRQR